MKTLIFSFFIFHFSLFIVPASLAQIIHVPGDYPTIQEGINASAPGDTILVDDGTYYENINFFGKKPLMLTSHFLMDGDTSHIVNTIINGSQPVDPDKGSVVTFESGEDTTAVICGFTITGGTGTIEPSVGIRMGGGLHIKLSGVKLLYNYVHDNIVSYEGGVFGGGMQLGAPIGTPPWLVLRGNKIYDNTAFSSADYASGGGIMCYYNIILENNEISGNTASGHLGGDGGGVGIAAAFGPITVKIKNNNFSFNTASTDLGTNDYATLGGGLGIYFDCSGEISNNVFEYNELQAISSFMSWGAGVFFQDINSAKFTFENNIVRYNTCTSPHSRGGGVSILRSGGLYQNNIIMDNTSARGGGFHTSESIDNGSIARLINNTIIGNAASYGGALYSYNSDAHIFNSILWGNTASSSGISIYNQNTSSHTEVRYSDVENTTVWPGEGNIKVDPGFIDDTCHLCLNSPCEDVGAASVSIGFMTYYAPDYDFEGTPRPYHLGFDMGADEVDISGIPDQGKEAGSQESAISIWPNPTTGKFQITNSKFHPPAGGPNSRIEIVDLTGNVVLEGNMEFLTANLELDISNLPAGIYMLRIIVDNEMITNKIIKL